MLETAARLPSDDEESAAEHCNRFDAWLCDLHVRASDQGFLPIAVEQYGMLLDWTGRELRTDQGGAIPDHLAPTLERLGLNRSNWVETVRGFGRLFKQAAGRSSSLIDAAAHRSRRWFQGKAAARAAFV